LHGYTFLGALNEPQYYKFTGVESRHPRSRRLNQGDGVSPLNDIGAAPLTVPTVALSLT
jgi:hypothetical protein